MEWYGLDVVRIYVYSQREAVPSLRWLLQRSRFNPQHICMGFVVDTGSGTGFASHASAFSLSLSFSQCSILIHSSVTKAL